jgi:probable HAF family extracellular repeat protein
MPRLLRSTAFILAAVGCAENPSEPASTFVDDAARRSASFAKVVYAAAPLPLENGFVNGSASAINDNGVIVGWANRAGQPPAAVLWRDGALIELPGLGGASSAASDINKKGEVVGWGETAGGAVHAILWRNGVPESLGTLGGNFSAAHGVNDKGRVVGSSENEAGEQNAFLWAGAMIDLGRLPGAGFAAAEDINNRGEIVGWSGGGCCFSQRATLWRNADVHDLGTLQFESAAFAINARSQIVGGSTIGNPSLPNLVTHTVIWEGGAIQDIGVAGFAAGINDRRQLVGTTDLVDCINCPFFWQQGTLIHLSPGERGSATDIEKHGRIVGDVGGGSAGGSVPMLWTETSITASTGMSRGRGIPSHRAPVVRSPTMRPAVALAICRTRPVIMDGISALEVAAGC